jgi:hypothetical protein
MGYAQIPLSAKVLAYFRRHGARGGKLGGSIGGRTAAANMSAKAPRTGPQLAAAAVARKKAG